MKEFLLILILALQRLFAARCAPPHRVCARHLILLGLGLLPNGAAAVSSAEFLPLAAGNSWSYVRETGAHSYLHVTAVPGTNDGSLVWTIQDLPENTEDYYSNDAQGIRNHGSYLPSFDLGGGQFTWARLAVSPPLLEAPPDVSPGQSVASTGAVSLTLGISATPYPLNYSFSNTFQGHETITVPAGIFRAFRAAGSLRIHGTLTGPGGTAVMDTTQTSNRWFASGIGLIQELTTSTDGTSSSFALINTSIVRTIPDAFTIPPATGVTPGSLVVSSPVTVTGTTALAPISVTGGEYSINGGPFTTAADTVGNGQNVVLRLTAPPAPSMSSGATLTVGGVSANLLVTTSGPLLPRLSLSSSSLDFGMAIVGSGIHPRRDLLLSNPGSAELNLSSVTAGGDFSVSGHNCGTTLGVGQTCTVSLVFAPSVAGSRNSSLSIVDDAAGSPHIVLLTGTALASGTTQPQVAGGNDVLFAIKDNQTLLAWGWNGTGMLGDSSTTDRFLPVVIGPGYRSISSQGFHTLGLKADGSLMAWGSNNFGQLGDGSYTDRATPVQIGSGYVAIAAGFMHNLALKADGSLWAWGNNQFGQVGDGTGQYRILPTRIGEDYTAISAGQWHSMALKSDGSLMTWGYNSDGQLGNGGTSTRWSPEQIGSEYQAIAAGQMHSVALKSDGSLMTWGWNNSGQLGDGTANNATAPQLVGRGFLAVGAGNQSSVALRNDGVVLAWGSDWAGALYLAHSTPTPIADGYGGLLTLFTPSAPMLGVSTTAGGRIISSPAGLDCGLTCTAGFTAGTQITLTAAPDAGYLFSGWSGACSGTAGTCTLTLNGSLNAAASFTRMVPTANITPGFITFPGQVFGTTSQEYSATLVNTGNGPLHIANVHISGDFAQSNDCGPVLAIGSSCTFNLTFTPRIVGGQYGALSVNHDAPSSNSVVQLYGIGLDPPPTYSESLSPASLDFGSQMVGSRHRLPVTLTNTGTGGINLGSIQVSGDFDQRNNCWAVGLVSGILPGGASCTIEVVFTPSGLGTLSGTLSLYDSITGSPHQLNLSGTGIAPPPGAVVASLVPGWNLLGNGTTGTVNVATVFGDANQVNTVWKWLPGATPGWAFYTPLQADGGAAYAASMGYGFLTTLQGGEGFWVNAKTGFSAALGSGSLYGTALYQDGTGSAGANPLPPGWSLIAVGDNPTPRAFANGILSPFAPPPTPGVPAATTLTTLWAWHPGDAIQPAGWLFYAPSLDNNGGLAGHISGAGYLDFEALGKTLDPSTGFWVNHP